MGDSLATFCKFAVDVPKGERGTSTRTLGTVQHCTFQLRTTLAWLLSLINKKPMFPTYITLSCGSLILCSAEARKMIPWLSNHPSKCHGKRKPTTGKTRRGKTNGGIAVTPQKVLPACLVLLCWCLVVLELFCGSGRSWKRGGPCHLARTNGFGWGFSGVHHSVAVDDFGLGSGSTKLDSVYLPSLSWKLPAALSHWPCGLKVEVWTFSRSCPC